MKPLALLFNLATAALMGCSAHPAASDSRSGRAPIELGSVAVPDQMASYHFSLDGDRDCELWLTSLPSGQVLVEAFVAQTVPLGETRQGQLLARPHAQARPGERVTLPVGEANLTLTLKQRPAIIIEPGGERVATGHSQG